MELFGNKSNEQKSKFTQEHSIIIHFNYHGIDLDVLHELEIKLIKIISDNNLGDYDGHEIAWDDTHGTLYMYTSNAENLFKAIKPTLEESPFMKGAIANLRFGHAGTNALEIDVEI